MKVAVRRMGQRTARTKELPVIFPDDPMIVKFIERLMGWTKEIPSTNIQAPKKLQIANLNGAAITPTEPRLIYGSGRQDVLTANLFMPDGG